MADDIDPDDIDDDLDLDDDADLDAEDDLDDDLELDDDLGAETSDDDEDEDEEDEAPPKKRSASDDDDDDEPEGRAPDEHICNLCFLLVRESQLGPKGNRSCPSGELESDCPAIAFFDANR